jgi:hypothetical protein
MLRGLSEKGGVALTSSGLRRHSAGSEAGYVPAAAAYKQGQANSLPYKRALAPAGF